MNEEIALGFGNNIDYEIAWDSEVFEDLVTQYGIRDEELDIDRPIICERDLVITILAFVKGGIGGERFVASSAIIERFSQRFENKITLGGTSVRAAIAMRKFGHTSAFHLVTINDHVRRLIPPDCPYVCSNDKDSSYPHLIVQYGEGVRVQAGDIYICSSQSNRLIYHCDYDNIVMNLNSDFAELITGAKILLISGFNAMQSADLLADRLASVLRMMDSLPEDALVFYEEAGFYAPRFAALIHRVMAGHVDIVSLNEDEMQNYLGRKLDLLNILQIEEALADLHRLIPAPVIVAHTKYWALAHGENAARFRGALKAGVTMATTRFLYGDGFTVENYHEVARLSPREDSAVFADAVHRSSGSSICCVPVARVDQSNGTTIGLGDAFVGGFLPSAIKQAGAR